MEVSAKPIYSIECSSQSIVFSTANVTRCVVTCLKHYVCCIADTSAAVRVPLHSHKQAFVRLFNFRIAIHLYAIVLCYKQENILFCKIRTGESPGVIGDSFVKTSGYIASIVSLFFFHFENLYGSKAKDLL